MLTGSRKLKDEDLTFNDITSDNIDSFKHLHTGIFPAPYPEKFFTEILKLDSDSKINKIAILKTTRKPVAVLSARVIPTEGTKILYLTSLGCKVYNRRQGICSFLLEKAVEWAKEHNCCRLYLHVQEGNLAALDFYRAKDFYVEKVVPNYYSRLQPPNAFKMYRNL